MENRRIRPAEVDAVTDLALEALARYAGDLPLHTSREKVRALVHCFCVHREHFSMAAFDQGRPVAAVALYVSEMPMHERCEGHVMFCYSRVPGAGMPLIAEMMAWVRRDLRIRRVQWAMNERPGRMASLIARRWGFTRRFETIAYYKGA